MAKDIFQQLDALDAAGIQRIVERLEFRGTYAPFTRMRDAYLERMQLAEDARVLDLGCGTGIVARVLAARPGFRGRIVGTDVSPALIEAAKRLAAKEGVGARIEFRVADAQKADDPDGAYDAVLLHTLISHVPSPEAVLAEAARMLRPAGQAAVFDGDYASLAFSSGERALDAELTQAILAAAAANPHVMRELPGLARRAGLKVAAFLPGVLAEAGKGEYFAGMAESLAPLAAKGGLVPADKVERWLASVREASKRGGFFASSNFHTYLLQKES